MPAAVVEMPWGQAYGGSYRGSARTFWVFYGPLVGGYSRRDQMELHRTRRLGVYITSWGFPKIGDPNLVPLNTRILMIRTPKQGTP